MASKKVVFSLKKAKSIIPRAKLAFKNEFYLETSWLISLAVEARLRSMIIRHERMNPGAGFTLEQCLKRTKFLIQKQPEDKLSSFVSVSMIDELRAWKNQRNLVYKAIESSHISKRRLQNLAEEGIELLQRLNESYRRYKREWKFSHTEVNVDQYKINQVP